MYIYMCVCVLGSPPVAPRTVPESSNRIREPQSSSGRNTDSKLLCCRKFLSDNLPNAPGFLCQIAPDNDVSSQQDRSTPPTPPSPSPFPSPPSPPPPSVN